MIIRILIFLFICNLSWAQNDEVIDYGQKLINENKMDEAILYFNQNLKNATTDEQKILLYFGLADIYKLELNYNLSNDYYIKAFQLINSTNNQQQLFLYHVKMAEFYRKRTLFEESVEQLSKAEVLRKNIQISDSYLTKYYNRKAALFTEYFQNQDSTFYYANRSLELAKKINDKDNIFYSSLEIANIYNQKKQFKEALPLFEELIEYAKNNNLIQHRADVYINYTRALKKDNQIDKALNILFVALDFAKEYDLLYHENIFTIDIYLIYKGQKNFEKANQYLEQRLELSEKYYKSEHNEFLFDLEKKYKVVEKENQIKIKNLELANKTRQLSANNVRLYIILGLFLIAILIVFLIAYFLKKSKKSNKELLFLSQQNEFLLSEANHRINNNLQLVIILITSQIKKIPENEGKEIKKILKKINSIATLHRHLYQSDDKRNVNIYKYLKDIETSFSDLFLENNIKTNFDIEIIELSADISMYLGLLLTELCINSIKHAFVNEDDRQIEFKLKKQNNALCFFYADNGAGLPSENTKPILMDKLCRQLKIKYTIENHNGFSFSFEKDLN